MSAGFPSAAKAKSGGVTFRPGQLKMGENIQRVAAVEKQTEQRHTQARGMSWFSMASRLVDSSAT